MPSAGKDLVSLESRSIPEDLNLSVFPNPAHSNVNLLFDGDIENIERVQILNIQGQLMVNFKKSTLHQINHIGLDRFTPGVYFIKAWSAHSSLIKKLIVE
jgi:hypothetical protein